MGGNGTRLVTPEGEGTNEVKDWNKGKKYLKEGKERVKRWRRKREKREIEIEGDTDGKRSGERKAKERGRGGGRNQTLYNPSRNLRSFFP